MLPFQVARWVDVDQGDSLIDFFPNTFEQQKTKAFLWLSYCEINIIPNMKEASGSVCGRYCTLWEIKIFPNSSVDIICDGIFVSWTARNYALWFLMRDLIVFLKRSPIPLILTYMTFINSSFDSQLSACMSLKTLSLCLFFKCNKVFHCVFSCVLVRETHSFPLIHHSCCLPTKIITWLWLVAADLLVPELVLVCT